MNIPEFFKYNTLISITLFSAVALLLVRKVPDFSFRKHTVSMSVHFLNRRTQAIIFRLNFIVKALLDLGFVFYIINHFNIGFGSIISLTLILSAFLFGSLAYFVEGKHSFSHNIIVYTSGVLFAIGQIYITLLIGDSGFIRLSTVIISIPIFLAFGFLFAKKTNALVQVVCMSIWYVWFLVLVFRYL